MDGILDRNAAGGGCYFEAAMQFFGQVYSQLFHDALNCTFIPEGRSSRFFGKNPSWIFWDYHSTSGFVALHSPQTLHPPLPVHSRHIETSPGSHSMGSSS